MPCIPDSDQQVLVRLPPRPPGEAALRARTGLEAAAAVDLARAYIEQGRARQDPRLLGRASALLEPWTERADPPAEVLVLRATLRQHRHDFDGALQDLDRVLAKSPDNAQAWLTRAVILAVQGRPRAALASCRPLWRLSERLLAAACSAHSAGLTKEAAGARRRPHPAGGGPGRE